MSRLLLDAISKNKRLERLIWDLPVCSTAFCRILTSLPMLVNLDIKLKGNSYSNTQRQAIASAFRSNKSLQHLTLYIQENEGLSSLIFESLAARATQHQLRELRLKSPFDDDDDDDGFFDGLSQILRSSCTLQRLYMEGFCWTDSNMTKVLSGIQHRHSNTGLPTISLRSLFFVRGSMDKEAGERLLMFLETAVTDLVGKEIYKSSLRQLGIRCDVDDLMTPTLSTQIAESLLMAAAAQTDPNADEVHRRQPTLLPTIGSQLDSVSVYHADESFLYHLRDNADRVRLHTLELEGNHDDGIAFYKCIPKLVSLRKTSLEPSLTISKS
jgi:hypothetical protein